MYHQSNKLVMGIEQGVYTAIVLDFETGGLDCTRCACTQIALQAVRLDTWEVLDRYVSYIAPYEKQALGGAPKRKVLKTRQQQEEDARAEPMDYEAAALSYTAITMDMLRAHGVDLRQVAADVIGFARKHTLSKGARYKPILIGQNIPFDVGFLQQMMAYAGLTKEFSQVFAGTTDFYGNFQPHYLDTIDLARLCFAGDASVSSYKLELIAERLGIELDDAHDADADATATRQVAALCSRRLRQGGGTADGITERMPKTRDHFKI